jgi:hypothetical protein
MNFKNLKSLPNTEPKFNFTNTLTNGDNEPCGIEEEYLNISSINN